MFIGWGFMPEGRAVPTFDRPWLAVSLTYQIFAGIFLGIAAQAILAWRVIFHGMPQVGLDLLDMAAPSPRSTCRRGQDGFSQLSFRARIPCHRSLAPGQSRVFHQGSGAKGQAIFLTGAFMMP
jgi:hypothetical protein